MKNKVSHFFGIAALVSVLVLELSLDHLLTQQLFYSCSWYYIIIIAAGILLVLSLIINRKTLLECSLGQVTKDLVKNTISGNMLDILYIAFFLLHLSWIPASIFEWIKADYCVVHPVIFISGLIFAIIIKPTFKKNSDNEYKVLFTGISDFKTFPNGASTIETLLKPLLQYSSIEKIIIFLDPNFKIFDISYFNGKINPELFTQWENLEPKSIANDAGIKILKQTIQELTSITDITIVDCTYEVIQTAYNIIGKQTNHFLGIGSYKDSHLIYNLTPGNKNISIALALNSIKANRHICYIQQSGSNKDKVICENLDVINLREIFSELV